MSGAEATGLPLSACAGKLSGTYLNTVTQPNGTFLLRSLATFVPSGALFVIESAQGGAIVGPYSDAQGAWRCVSAGPNEVKAKATVLDFTYSSPQFIARIDYDITMNAALKTFTGTLEVRVYPLDGNPLPPPNTPAFTYNISGERVRAN